HSVPGTATTFALEPHLTLSVIDPCPLWVMSGHFASHSRCPLYPPKADIRWWISEASACRAPLGGVRYQYRLCRGQRSRLAHSSPRHPLCPLSPAKEVSALARSCVSYLLTIHQSAPMPTPAQINNAALTAPATNLTA